MSSETFLLELTLLTNPPPQLFLEPKTLYRSAVEQVPVGDYQLPLSSAEVLQEGTDVTIVSYGPPLYSIESALHTLKHPTDDIAHLIPEDMRKLSVELIDLRTIMPYDVSRCIFTRGFRVEKADMYDDVRRSRRSSSR